MPALALLAWRARRRGSAAAIVFPSVARLRGLRPTLRQRAAALVPALEGLALLGLVVAAARPRQGDSRTVVRSEGIAIQMVLDRSGSMEETMRYGGAERKRIDIVKDVFQDFVRGGKELPGRKTDLIGLTTFARFTEESCPLVSTHEPLITAVKNLRTVAPALDRYDQPVWDLRGIDMETARRRGLKENPLNKTAIGDGLQRAILSLVSAEEDLGRGEGQGGYKIQGKVAIVLTDGENNAGDVDPVEAGKYAASNGIKVYFILFAETTVTQRDLFGRRIVQEIPEDQILETPRQVAGESGGKAFLARSGDELREIYADIDRLERSDVGRIEYRSYREKYRWFLGPAIALLCLAAVLEQTLFRRIP